MSSDQNTTQNPIPEENSIPSSPSSSAQGSDGQAKRSLEKIVNALGIYRSELLK